MPERDDLGLDEAGGSRRKFLKQAATVAWASPLIVTMMSRTASAQQAMCGTLLLFAQPGGGSQLRCFVAQRAGRRKTACRRGPR